jgi:hypothetical protein
MLTAEQIEKIGENLISETIKISAEVDDIKNVVTLNLIVSGIVYAAELSEHDMDDEDIILEAWKQILEQFSVYPILQNGDSIGSKH